jgi:hypothetical protein
MGEIASIEQTLLETVRWRSLSFRDSLPQSQQEAVLSFARSLSQNLPSSLQPVLESLPPLHLSLQQVAKLPIAERNALIAPYISAMAEDFQNDPELTEFSVLDTEDWEE